VGRSESAGHAGKKNAMRRAMKRPYTLPPIPILKSGDETPMIAEMVSEMVSDLAL
jgi:hypothetical protein